MYFHLDDMLIPGYFALLFTLMFYNKKIPNLIISITILWV